MAFRIDPASALTNEIARVALEQNQIALDALALARSDHDRGVHDARKAFKKLRALLRLVRSCEREFARRENDRYRTVAASLAGSREAGALVETVERLRRQYPDQASPAGLGELHDALVAERDGLAREETRLDVLIDDAVAACRQGRDALERHPFDHVDSACLATGMRSALKAWRKAARRLRKKGQAEDFHDLRKAVKAHWTHLGLLRPALSRDGGGRGRRARVEALGETLGALNDLHVMRAAIKSGTLALPPTVPRKPLLRLLREAARRLERSAMRRERRLRRQRPRKLARRLHAAHRDALDAHTALQSPSR